MGPVVTIDEPAKLSALTYSSTSSLGRLDSLSLEVLWMILRYLDIRSPSRLLRVSHRGRAAVESLPLHRELMKYIPNTLKALGKCRLLCYYTGHNLLVSQGKLLYDLWKLWFLLIPSNWAQSIYGLETDDLKELTVFKTISGVYKTYAVEKSQRRLKLLHRHAAMELADMKLEEQDRVQAEYIEKAQKASLPWPECSRVPYWPDSDDSGLGGGPDVNGVREFIGMEAIRFPHLRPDNTLEYGHSCKGCKWEYLQYESDRVLYDMSFLGQKEYQVPQAL
ncbi:hypothetical protein H113_05729 [Trichophyton rubrum MR1459]|uniref:F-box domain-containing protein n=3 Tax=Trichophyton TaxID=5550 RepID=F2SK44_TRIRC|nr:uncharacterized protein TERG_03397 [Trichophyton rubrum CBS 118892]EGD87147.2 hypothetical protein TERG_03397 [Trichophyton rubrum CBS 118892]EZF93552.1 hypothetical protein H113_05729 [Trichophyton rubrum MR1459]